MPFVLFCNVSFKSDFKILITSNFGLEDQHGNCKRNDMFVCSNSLCVVSDT